MFTFSLNAYLNAYVTVKFPLLNNVGYSLFEPLARASLSAS